ncbi:2-keto-4-pentenoate hydratase [Streptomyces iconiensis]|uniref:Fumarylacetoacetate hydrolase family protein n=1 Tax=Streptomyces iconiensis TaxID=1384038 RepID=A0ABT6ZR37_9ACTN|nr:fumarylacetoacetate hydrolase family protein [Streptomyces iconiensis]MDJ1130993.1 fumarylacetoacetate hydrolase family protein [Streptomyces iconiensis]
MTATAKPLPQEQRQKQGQEHGQEQEQGHGDLDVRIAALAATLDEAALTGRTVPKLTDSTELDVPGAYRVQRALIDRRVARGERLSGFKMGFTSRAKMAQMGVEDVIRGLLTDAMAVEDGGVLDVSGLAHPRIEPEIAFLIGEPLTGRVSPTGAARAVAGVAVAYEVLDSRYDGFSFTLPDVIADNASAAAFGFGDWLPFDGLDVSTRGMVLEINGRTAAVGSSAAILGDPVRSLIAAARLAEEAGLPLQPGQVVLAGAATAAVPLPSGAHARVTAAGLGRVEVTTR